MQHAWAASLLIFVFGCGSPGGEPPLTGPAELVLLHTSDTHSQLFPWRTVVGWWDAQRGLGESGTLAEVGGFARLATLLRAERAAAPRVLHLDSGDLFQGSLTFERFTGEPEVLAFDALGVDAQALGNHELDRGAAVVAERYRTLSRFPLLAANYVDDSGGENAGISGVVQPFVVLTAGGLRVGVIGAGNTSSVALLKTRPNELGVTAENVAQAVQGAVDTLRPLVNLVVAVTHLGVDADTELVRRTSGLDLVLGGHQHIALDEPEWERDCAGGSVTDAWGRERRCAPRRVAIVHSGAYGKFLGRLALSLDDEPARLSADYDPLDGHEVVALSFELLPVHAELPEDPAMARLLAPYREAGALELGANGVVGYAPALLERGGATGGDSPLGNLAAEAVRAAAEAELAVLGASSLRHDLPPGVLDQAELLRVVPFEDPVVRVELTGAALLTAFERAARSASGRECRTQVHVAGALVRFRCPCDASHCASVFAPATAVPCASDLDCAALGGACGGASDGANGRCFAPVSPSATYRVATTAYLASGGSGLFEPIPDSARRLESESLNAALAELIRGGESCVAEPELGGTDGTMDAREASAGSEGTSCETGCAAALLERAAESCVAEGLSRDCATADDDCARAVAQCRYVPCVDARLGAARDGRIRFEAP